MPVRFVSSFALVAAIGLAAQAAPVRGAAATGPGALAVVVRDAKGNGIVGALVVATGPVVREATTISGGIVVLQALPLGSYDVSVTKAGYAPLDTTTVVKAVSGSPQLLAQRLAPADYASAGAAATLDAGANPADDPFVSHALVQAPGVDIVPDAWGDGSAAALEGTTPLESRVEVDGIPVAGGFSGAAALRFRSALALDSVAIAPGLAAAPEDTALDTVGGTVNYRTAAVAGGLSAGAEAGYDSTYGSFQRTRYSDTFGRLGLLTDLVTGGGVTRSQILKAQYAFSPVTTLGVSSYSSQSTAGDGTGDATNVAPAAAIDLKTGFGSATAEVRTYRSSSRTDDTGQPEAAGDDRIYGTQAKVSVPAGSALLAVGFDTRSERTSSLGALLERTYSTLTARASIPLARGAQIELADAYGGGSQLHRRHDPHATLTLGQDGAWTVRLAAGSAYATLPLDVLAELPLGERDAAPETSLGYRASFDYRLDGRDRLWASASTQRRFDTLAMLSQARTRGIEIGFERTDRTGLGALAYLDLQRAYGFGSGQPYANAAQTDFSAPQQVAGEQLAGDAYSKARAALTYRLPGGIALRLGTTFLGSNNAFAQRAFALGDASFGVPLGSLVEARFGVDNAFGHPVADPILAREYAPHEVTFSLGRR